MNPEESAVFKDNVLKILDEVYKSDYVKVKDGDVFVYEIKNVESLLNWAVTNDYLLHGSTRLIKESLKPYQANDKIKESGNRKAVYVTRVPAVAMFCALTGGVDGLERRHRSHIKIDDRVIRYSEMYFGVNDIKEVRNAGYIYILGKWQVDEEINGEFLAYKEIDPMLILKIPRNSFNFIINEFKDDVD